jgi:hypothetical protein
VSYGILSEYTAMIRLFHSVEPREQIREAPGAWPRAAGVSPHDPPPEN